MEHEWSTRKDRKVLQQLTLTGSAWEQVTRNNIPVTVLQLQRYVYVNLCKEKLLRQHTLKLRCQNTIRSCDISKVAPDASMTCGSYFDKRRSLQRYVWGQFCLCVSNVMIDSQTFKKQEGSKGNKTKHPALSSSKTERRSSTLHYELGTARRSQPALGREGELLL